ncbi:tRNA (guanine-N(7)-)-methyltransferase [Camelimonas fluminis]|uniref:tRNA (guanine-N(7)-)-methyltransferase n=1 Tax=Camelimonas fluminis TaxID=1576911 RepID=A0ABV7UKQ3_9HYPH|nr:tRNA (guanine(46)-N(7))-methyltransferase TrmB [Camelimonas fluminis]GHE54371.1 tRNA (guanine-N(7)-)-methyltransferase [Camelimonas fluminis]
MTTEQPRAGSFYGRRKGHRLREQQSRLMEETLPRLRIGPDAVSDVSALFARPVSQTWLEIGFGGGEHLLHQMQLNPDVGFIGCEPFINGMAKLLAGEPDEQRLALHDADATELLPRLPAASIDRAFVLYPDPWPKRRQRKRRIISHETVSNLARVLKPGAIFRFATDIDDYAAWTLARVMASGQFDWAAERADDWRLAWTDWPGTRYEQKAFREGRTPAYLTFVRREARNLA